MTDQDNLRDRIADAMKHELRPGIYDNIIGIHAAAQAIIDELGLTVETRVSSVGRTVDRRTGIVTNSTQTRIVGKWEQQR